MINVIVVLLQSIPNQVFIEIKSSIDLNGD
jgi:hypothetical protein